MSPFTGQLVPLAGMAELGGVGGSNQGAVHRGLGGMGKAASELQRGGEGCGGGFLVF